MHVLQRVTGVHKIHRRISKGKRTLEVPNNTDARQEEAIHAHTSHSCVPATP